MAAATEYRQWYESRLRWMKQEFILHLLQRKKIGLPVACGHIVEKQIYGDDATPWNILTDDDPWMACGDVRKKVIFVITKLSNFGISRNCKVDRLAGCGAWLENSLVRNIINLQGQIMGKTRTLSFYPKKGFESEMKGKGHWVMYETSIEGCDYVVCVIKKILSEGGETTRLKSVANLMDKPTEWLVNTGATNHICSDKKLFSSYIPINGKTLHMANSSTSNIVGLGKVALKLTSGKVLLLNNVLHDPDVHMNLLSGASLVKQGFRLVFEADNFVLSKSEQFLEKGYIEKGLFKMNVIVVHYGGMKIGQIN